MKFLAKAALLFAFCPSGLHAADPLIFGVQEYGETPRVLAGEFKCLADFKRARIIDQVS